MRPRQAVTGTISVSNPNLRPQFFEFAHVAGMAVAEAEIAAHQHGSRSQPVHQNAAHELLRRKARHLGGERQNQNLLHAFLAQQPGAPVGRRHQPGRRFGRHHARGMRIER